ISIIRNGMGGNFSILIWWRQHARLVGEEERRRLHLALTAYSSTADNFGGSGGPFGLAFPVPDAIKEASCTTVVNRAEAVGCASNPSLSVTDVEFRGNFFNTESSPTSQIGDVVGVIGISRTPTDVGGALTVAGFYTRCNDQFCGNRRRSTTACSATCSPMLFPPCASNGIGLITNSFFS